MWTRAVPRPYVGTRISSTVGKNRWVGAYWQTQGLTVYPTVSWGSPRTYSFCFEGIQRGSIVAVGVIGYKESKTAFLRGYNAMLDAVDPEGVICFGTPFPEMEGIVAAVDYLSSRKVVR